MKLYHGSKLIIEEPITKGSGENNDYGPAFYLTLNIESAHEWACRNNSVGVVNEYSFDLKNLLVLDLTDKSKYSVLNWVAILMHFRTPSSSLNNNYKNRLKFLEDNYYIDINQYDVVIGYRADDAYFRFPRDFLNGNITLEQLNKSFELGDLGIQYALISEKAIKELKYIKCIESNGTYINSYFENVRRATEKYNQLDFDEEGTRIFDIMRKK